MTQKQQANTAFYKVNINKIGHKKLESLKSKIVKPHSWWVEIDDSLLVYGPQEHLYEIMYTLEQVEFSLIASNLHKADDKTDVLDKLVVMRHMNVNELAKLTNVNVLIEAVAGYSILYAPSGITSYLKSRRGFMKLQPYDVLARRAINDENQIDRTKLKKNSIVKEMVDSVKVEDWQEIITKIASWNRFSLGSQINQAKDYLKAELNKLNVGLRISEEDFRLSGKTISNLIADYTVNPADKDYYIIGAHLDSISEKWGNERVAPGAEDNGSSSAGLLVMAKALTKFKPKKNIRFIWFLGEEQGLVGSTANAINLVARGEQNNMKYCLNMDMIGFSTTPQNVRVLLETDRKYERTLDLYKQAAATYCDLDISVSYNPFGSDHVPYLRRGMEAILTIDADYGKYPHYHRSTDRVEYLVPKMAYEILKMNVAFIGNKIYV